MKGFYITIKNELLDPKHYQAIGESIWLFLWLLDKMTIIDHEVGVGKVLGGRPIKYQDVQDDIGVSDKTYRRWIEILRDGRYIETIRTPQGLSIMVNKAFKVFGQESDRSNMTDQIGHKRPIRSATNDRSNIRQDSMTIQLDKIRDHFEEFWKAYPRKISRKKTEQIFGKIKMTPELFSKIMKTLEAYKRTPQWTKDAGAYIPHPTTWLNQERYNDEIAVVSTGAGKYDNL